MLAFAKTKPGPGAELIDIPKPQISRPDEILVKIMACGICGSDLHFYEMAPGMEKLLLSDNLPLVFGHEASGIIEEVGSAVTGLKPGDHIVCDTRTGCGQCYTCRTGKRNHCKKEPRIGIERNGAFAEYVAMPASCAYLIDSDVDLIEASVLEPCGVALRAIENVNIHPGDSVAIIGPGPIGLMAGYLAQHITSARVAVIGLPADKDRLAFGEKIGLATYTITGDNEKDYAQLRKLSYSGMGFDYVIDSSGSTPGVTTALEIVIPGGTVSVFGVGSNGKIDNDYVVDKELTIQGSFRRNDTTWFRTTYMLASKGIDIKQFVSHVMPLTEIETAFQMLMDKKATKIIITP